jgi:sarcosine oxidase subunit delta
MQLIECPWCGPREEIDFTYGGQAHVPYPAEPATLDDVEWAQYIFYRDNVKGLFAERWMHSAGCRKWFNAVRDTLSYRFHSVYKPGEAPAFPASAPAASPKGTEIA